MHISSRPEFCQSTRTQYINFVAASDHPFDMTDDQQRQNLMKFSHKGQPVFTGFTGYVVEDLVVLDTPNLGPALREETGYWRITDDNMATEFKTNGSGAWWRSFWARVYRPEHAWIHRFF